MTDLVVVSLEAWDEVWRRNQHLVAGLLRSDAALRVLFVEPPADPTHDLRSGRRPSFARGVREVPDVAPGRSVRGAAGEVAAPPTRPARRRAPGARRDARRRLARHAASAALDQRPRRGRARRAVGLADAVRHHRRLARGRSVARRAASAPRRTRPGCSNSPREVVVCSPELVRRKGANRPVTLIPNAVDVDAYRRPAPRPADLPDGPVALYLGTVHPDRIDVDLCEATARALGAAGTLVLVGPNLLAAEQVHGCASGRAAARPAPARRGDRLPAARRRARRAARRDRVHRQPRPHQALRIPGRRAAGRVDSGRGIP